MILLNLEMLICKNSNMKQPLALKLLSISTTSIVTVAIAVVLSGWVASYIVTQATGSRAASNNLVVRLESVANGADILIKEANSTSAITALDITLVTEGDIRITTIAELPTYTKVQSEIFNEGKKARIAYISLKPANK